MGSPLGLKKTALRVAESPSADIPVAAVLRRQRQALLKNRGTTLRLNLADARHHGRGYGSNKNLPAHRHTPRIFSAPLSPDNALGNVSALIGLPHVRAVSVLDGFVDANKHVLGETPVRCNLVLDVHPAKKGGAEKIILTV
jgi:hypothetical protein